MKEILPTSPARRCKVYNSSQRLQYTCYQETRFILIVRDHGPPHDKDGHYGVRPCHGGRGVELV